VTIRKTAAIRRGLREIAAYAYADFEAGMDDDPPRWSKREADEMLRAFAWLREQYAEPDDQRGA